MIKLFELAEKIVKPNSEINILNRNHLAKLKYEKLPLATIMLTSLFYPLLNIRHCPLCTNLLKHFFQVNILTIWHK